MVVPDTNGDLSTEGLQEKPSDGASLLVAVVQNVNFHLYPHGVVL